MQYGASTVSVVGGEAAPYDVFIGNTNPASTETIVRQVLQVCAKTVTGEDKLNEQLEILEVECLTKDRNYGYKTRTKSWRVSLPHKFRDHMMKPVMIIVKT